MNVKYTNNHKLAVTVPRRCIKEVCITYHSLIFKICLGIRIIYLIPLTLPLKLVTGHNQVDHRKYSIFFCNDYLYLFMGIFCQFSIDLITNVLV